MTARKCSSSIEHSRIELLTNDSRGSRRRKFSPPAPPDCPTPSTGAITTKSRALNEAQRGPGAQIYQELEDVKGLEEEGAQVEGPEQPLQEEGPADGGHVRGEDEHVSVVLWKGPRRRRAGRLRPRLRRRTDGSVTRAPRDLLHTPSRPPLDPLRVEHRCPQPTQSHVDPLDTPSRPTLRRAPICQQATESHVDPLLDPLHVER
eukprot:741198-Prorocentrum_minimum.AAC.1